MALFLLQNIKIIVKYLMKNITLLIITFLTVSIGYANHVFNAIIVEGDIVLKNGNENQVLRANAKIHENFSLVLKPSSYVALIHQTGRTLELQEAGTYKVSDLSKMITEQLNGYTNKYTDFLFDKDKPKVDYSKTASVKRPSQKIQILTPIDAKILPSKTFSVHWTSNLPKETNYVLQVTDIMNNIMYEQSIVDTFLTIDLSDKAKTNFYQVRVSTKGESPSEIKLLPHQGNAKIEKDLVFIQETYNEKKAFDCIVIAKFFEEHELILHAQHYIEKAISLSPTTGYKDYYNCFLRNYKIQQ